MSKSSELQVFIELDRRFEKLEREEPSEASALRSYTTRPSARLFGIEAGLAGRNYATKPPSCGSW